MGNAILKGQTGGASPTVISQKKLTLLADVTIYSARTSVDFTGLNVGADTELLLVADVINQSGYSLDYYFYANGNMTSTNYWTQRMFANGTSISSDRNNDSRVSANTNGAKSYNIIKIKLTNNGSIVFQNDMNRDYGASGQLIQTIYGTSTFTASSITSLNFSNTTTPATIGIGSRFQLYSLNTGGEKTWVTS